ncbi:TRM11 family methyltransferase [Algoriphagus resistens]|uniref:methyltransferase n=1 Tax=Algoriphagus resistens TaxID=1750590 RepID=UPI0009E72F9F|nr:methyltransferase [Algoriphagus resistens]
MEKLILDACCGSRMFWFDKENPNAVFIDIRKEEFISCDGRSIKVRPDMIADFRNLPFDSQSFKMVVFDPPHDMYAGTKSFTAQKYGKLDKDNWREDLKLGFDECMRVLQVHGFLIFKWNELRIPVTELLRVFEMEPLFGHKSGKASNTHWMIFMKST